MEHILIPHDWKEFVFHRGCSFSIQPIFENGLIEEIQARKDDRPSSSHLSTLSGKNPDEEAPSDDFTIPKKVHCHCNAKRNQDAAYWVKISEHKIKDCDFGRRNHVQ